MAKEAVEFFKQERVGSYLPLCHLTGYQLLLGNQIVFFFDVETAEAILLLRVAEVELLFELLDLNLAAA